MPRRRELKSLASGLARHCVSRNNDIAGYWAIGILYRLALERAADCLPILVMGPAASASLGSSELRAFQTSFLERFHAARHGLAPWVVGIEAEFRFERHSFCQVRGPEARITCTVHLIDDLGKRRSASASTFCYPHHPRFERRSTRASC